MGENGERKDWVDFAAAKAVPFEMVMEATGLSGKLRRDGEEWKGICPLHGGTKESFGFNVAKGYFKCFGCKRSGNVLDFVNQWLFEGKNIKDAARWLVALATPAAHGNAGEIAPADEAESSTFVADGLSEHDRAVCRGVARYLAAVFAPLANIDVIEQELARFVSEEVKR
jgi:hypothetical protein